MKGKIERRLLELIECATKFKYTNFFPVKLMCVAYNGLLTGHRLQVPQTLLSTGDKCYF